MKFVVYRTSTWSSQCPCEEAEYDDDNERWVMELKNLDELIEFCSKYGEIIVNSEYDKQLHCIEIYDTYRE